MSNCKCGKLILADWKFCPGCGCIIKEPAPVKSPDEKLAEEIIFCINQICDQKIFINAILSAQAEMMKE